MKFSIKHTADDALETMGLNYSFHVLATLVLFCTGVITFNLTFYFIGAGDPLHLFYVGIFLVVLAILYRRYRQLKKILAEHGTTHYTVTSKGIAFESDTVKSLYKWSMFEHAKMNKYVLGLRLKNSRNYFGFPKRAFTEKKWEELQKVVGKQLEIR